jgi:hypothetical protein
MRECKIWAEWPGFLILEAMEQATKGKVIDLDDTIFITKQQYCPFPSSMLQVNLIISILYSAMWCVHLAKFESIGIYY